MNGLGRRSCTAVTLLTASGVLAGGVIGMGTAAQAYPQAQTSVDVTSSTTLNTGKSDIKVYRTWEAEQPTQKVDEIPVMRYKYGANLDPDDNEDCTIRFNGEVIDEGGCGFIRFVEELDDMQTGKYSVSVGGTKQYEWTFTRPSTTPPKMKASKCKIKGMRIADNPIKKWKGSDTFGSKVLNARYKVSFKSARKVADCKRLDWTVNGAVSYGSASGGFGFTTINGSFRKQLWSKRSMVVDLTYSASSYSGPMVIPANATSVESVVNLIGTTQEWRANSGATLSFDYKDLGIKKAKG